MSDRLLPRWRGWLAGLPLGPAADAAATGRSAEDRIILGAGVGATAIGLAAVTGYLLGEPDIASVVPSFKPVAALTGLSFIALAISIFGIHSRTRAGKRTSDVLALAVGALTAMEVGLSFAHGQQTGLERSGVLFHPYTSTSILLFATASAIFLIRRRAFLAHVLGSAVLAATIGILFGYLLAIPRFIDPEQQIAPVWSTVVGLLLLSSAAVLIRPRGWVALVVSPTLTGLMLRSLLPLAVVIPLPITWALVSLRGFGWYTQEAEIALITGVNGAALNALLLFAAGVLLHGREMREKALERVLRAISEANQVMIRERNSPMLLESVCRVIVEHGGFNMAWIGVVDHAVKRVVPVASAGKDDGYVAAIDIRLDDSPHGHGPTALCVKEKVPQIVDDFASDGRTLPWRGAALSRGYNASTAFPLLVDGRAWGAMTVYSERAGAFHREAATLLEDVAANLSRTLESIAAEKARTEAEERARTASAYNRTLIETSLDPLVTIDSEGKITDVSAATEAATGRSRDELIGSDFSDYFTEPEKAREGYRTVLATGTVRDYPLTLLHRDGGTMDVLYNASVFRGPDGTTQGVFAAARDVTRRKKAEEALVRSEARYRALAEQLAKTLADLQRAQEIARLGNWDLDLESGAITWSDELYRIYGFDREQAAPRYDAFLRLLFDRENAERLDAVVKRAIEAGEPWTIDLELLPAPGRMAQWIMSRGEAVRDESGKITGLRGITLDVTERKLAARRTEKLLEALDSSERLYRSIVESTQDGVWMIDAEGVTTFVNARMAEMLGCTPEEMRGRMLIDFMDEEGIVITNTQVERRRAGIREEHDFKFIRKDGTPIWTILATNPLTDHSGHYAGALAVATDITERKKAELLREQLADDLQRQVEARTADLRQRTEALEAASKQLLETNRELEAFTYSVSHDLRTPLRTLDGFSHILEEQLALKPDSPATEYLRRIRAAADRMSQLIDDLLALSRVGRHDMHLGPVDLSAIASAKCEALRQSSPSRKAELIVPPGITATGDGALLRIVIDNLLENAWKFTSKHESTRIEVGTTEADGERFYFVRDDGAGFDPRYADKLFKPFQRLHTPSEFEGTGIGLATVQRIVSRHGGQIRAEGTIEGGATIYFSLAAGGNG